MTDVKKPSTPLALSWRVRLTTAEQGRDLVLAQLTEGFVPLLAQDALLPARNQMAISLGAHILSLIHISEPTRPY